MGQQAKLDVLNPSSSGLVLRPYQDEAVNAMWNGLVSDNGNHLVVLPTGTGKSLVIAEFVRRMLSLYPDCRILIMTHSKELVSQNFKEQIGLWPECPAGINNAGLGQRDVTSTVIFGSIQSMHRSAFQLQRVEIIIVDEAQSIPRDSEKTWNRFFSEVRRINPDLRVIGLTATDYRLDSGKLTDGDDAMFSRVVYEYSILDAIGDGYLTMPISRSAETQIDTSDVGTRGGEFIPSQLDAVASDPLTVEAIADEICNAGHDRRGWIVFGAGVKHCTMIRDAIRRRGYSCEGVFAVTPKAERDDYIARFKRQEIRCLVSVSALAVGFNAKHVDLVGLARPTKSTGLYIQICGRGMRLFPGKENCLMLDFGGNIARHGYIDKPNIKKPGEGGGEMPMKICKHCESPNFIAARECSTCGARFEIEGSKISPRAANAPLLSTQASLPQWVRVDGVSYSMHNKPGKPTSLKVTYQSGLTFHSEWVTLEHPGNARKRAEAWWLRRTGEAVPVRVQDALAMTGELRKPTEILVKPNGQYTEIMGAKFND